VCMAANGKRSHATMAATNLPAEDQAVIDAVGARTWAPGSWRQYESLQMASYEDQPETYTKVMAKLGKVPPLVQPAEVDKLTSMLAAAGRGEAFIIQGGDCAERFMDCEAERLDVQLSLLMQMGAIVERSAGKKAVRIARLAGQYGKPRSSPKETVAGVGEVMSFKGDNINGYALEDRAWDSKRLLEGYWHSAATLNYVRGLAMADDFASSMMSKLDVTPLQASPKAAEWNTVVSGIKATPPDLSGVFTAHEAMQLDLEEALTRPVLGKGYYNLSAHMVWIGDRTRQITGGHVEYFRGIKNPVGCKVGPTMTPPELRQLVHILNPDKIEGRLVLITRYGNSKIEQMLPAHIKAVQETGVPVVWQTDGVHGNTTTAAANKKKTRNLNDVCGEYIKSLAVHKAHGSVLGGIHLEMTGQATVTECTGGYIKITEDMLTNNYETYCDPRFNYSQSIEAAFTVADALKA